MAHSIQIFEQRSKSFNDLDLLIVITFVIAAIATESEQTVLLKIRDRWSVAVKSYGPGVLDLEFDFLIRSQSERSSMVGIIDRVRSELEAWETKIPATVLNERVQISGVRFHDYPVESVIKTTHDLKKLLLG